MSATNDGGQAFPRPNHEGMSLRDWFAGQALEKAARGGEKTAYDIAIRAYYIADAMLAARGAK